MRNDRTGILHHFQGAINIYWELCHQCLVSAFAMSNVEICVSSSSRIFPTINDVRLLIVSTSSYLLVVQRHVTYQSLCILHATTIISLCHVDEDDCAFSHRIKDELTSLCDVIVSSSDRKNEFNFRLKPERARCGVK